MGRPIYLVYISIMNAVVETTLCFVLVPRYQINGAALASTLTYLNSAAVITWYFCKNSGLSPVDVWLPTIADVRTVMRAIRPGAGGFDALKIAVDEVRKDQWTGGALNFDAVSSQEFVICGWTEPRGGGRHFDALLLGVFDRGKLFYAGHADSGLDEPSLAALYEQLAPLETTGCPFRVVPNVSAPVHWVKPMLVAAISFGEWTREGVLVEPVYMGLRLDRRPEECVRTPSSP